VWVINALALSFDWLLHFTFLVETGKVFYFDDEVD